MALITIQPTAADTDIANAIAAHTTPEFERAAQCLTWGADEKVLLALAVGGWLCATYRPALRPIANHMLTVSILTAILPHVLKSGIDQTRPDRLTVKGHWRGIPFPADRVTLFLRVTPFTWERWPRPLACFHRSHGVSFAH
jgi:undecaprenyl-diphosphatase